MSRTGFSGHSMLGGMSLIHMNGRVMDAATGRFLSADPFVLDSSNTQSFNRYSYVVNNPLTLIDPTGFAEQPATILKPNDQGPNGLGGMGMPDIGGMLVPGERIPGIEDPVTLYIFDNGAGTQRSTSADPPTVIPCQRGDCRVKPSAPQAAQAAQSQPCQGQTPLTLGQANNVFRNNTTPSTTVSEDASQLSVKQVDPFSGNGNALGVMQGGSWFVHGSVTLHQDSSGNVSILPDTYHFLPHAVSFSDPHWFREGLRNVETYAGFYVATYGGLTEYWADLTGGNHATNFTSTFCGSPTVTH